MRQNDPNTGEVTWVPPPEGVKVLNHHLENAEEILRSHGNYCKACWILSRDMPVLGHRSKVDPQKLTIIQWAFDLAEMVDGAESGCQFCALFSVRYFADAGFRSFDWGGSSRLKISCCSMSPRADSAESNRLIKDALEKLRKVLADNPEANFTFVVEPLDYRSSDSSFCRVRFSPVRTLGMKPETFKRMVTFLDLELEIYATKNSIASANVKRRPFNTRPASCEGIEQAKAWIKDCIDNHEECLKPDETALPTRVVEILGNDRLVLRETDSQKDSGTYVALSYCWGGQQTFATTISSYADRLEGFVKEDLPQTLQDGVHLAKELGARYIWIDSLCILQDSPEDKERELPKMSQYYSNAYVVISAAHAEKASDGFLEPRLVCKSHPDSGLPSDLSRMPVLTLGDEYGEMLFRQPMPYSLNDEPIERRAWALQERALSARVLIYGVYTVWQCNHHQRCDGGVDDFGYEVRDFNFRHHLGKGKTEPSPARGKPESRPGPVSMPEELYENWRKAVHAYSIRQLSFESDKLPAIAGLAQAFAETTGDHYLAGLWQTRLLRELLWSTRPEIPTARPEERRAPSWSWASVDYDITYKHLPPADATPVATVVSCTVTPASPDHIFGHNKEGRLELDAILLEIDGSTLKQILDAEYKQRGPDAALGFFSPDLWEGIVNRHRLSEGQRKREEFRPPERCFILPLFAVPPPEGQGEDKCQVIHGLALSVNADGTYERIVDFADVEMDEASLKAMSRDLTKRVVIV